MKGFKVLTVICALVSLVAANTGKISTKSNNDPCNGLDDGVFFPVAGDCTKFLLCYGGVAIEQDCGKYHFNPKLHICEHPDKAGCQSTLFLTTSAPTKSVCSGYRDGTMLPVAGSSSKYYICMSEKAFLEDCGSLMFHPAMMQCIPQSQNTRPTPPTPPCYAVANGISLPVSGNPRQYYYCLNNKAFLKDCGNLYFVAKYSACARLPENESQSSYTSVKPFVPSINKKSEVTACYGKPNGVSIAVAGNQRQFYYCLDNKAFLKDCGNLFYVAKYSACGMFPDNESQTVANNIQPAIPSTNHEAAVTVCYGKPNGVSIAVAGNKRQYYYCLNNKAFLKDCGNLFFVAKYSACAMLPDNESQTVANNVQPVVPSINQEASVTVCYGKPNGVSIAVAGNKRQFYYCLFNKAYLKDCGNLFYVAKYSACGMFPDNESQTVANNIQPAIPSTNHEAAVTVCYGKPNGVSIAVAGNKRQYYYCLNNKAFLKDCGNLFFVAKYSACAMFPDNESQTVANNVQPVVPSINQEAAVTVCYGKPNGVSIAVAGNKRQFYYCLFNKAYLKDCGNLFYVAKYSACGMFPDNESQTVPSIKKEAELKVCYGKPSGTSIPVAGNQRQYYYCMNNKAFLKDCGHLFFASKYSACATTPDSKEIGFPVEEITMTDSFDEIARRECKNQAFGARVAFPGTCSWYIICTYNGGFLKSCSWREFNTKTASCDLPENVRCNAHVDKEDDKTTKNYIIPTTATPIDTLAARICKNEEDGTFKAAPGQCSDFYFCLQKKGYRKSCGPNRHFDSKSVTCIDSKESSCVDIWPIAPRAFSPRAASCANQEIGTLVSSDTDCSKFYICDNQGPVELDCPAGLHFSAKEKLCDWPVNAECSLKK